MNAVQWGLLTDIVAVQFQLHVTPLPRQPVPPSPDVLQKEQSNAEAFTCAQRRFPLIQNPSVDAGIIRTFHLGLMRIREFPDPIMRNDDAV